MLVSNVTSYMVQKDSLRQQKKHNMENELGKKK